jgi:hypothetical protein
MGNFSDEDKFIRFNFIQIVARFGYIPVFRPDGKVIVFRTDNMGGFYEFKPSVETLREITSSPVKFVTELTNHFTCHDIDNLP